LLTSLKNPSFEEGCLHLITAWKECLVGQPKEMASGVAVNWATFKKMSTVGPSLSAIGDDMMIHIYEYL